MAISLQYLLFYFCFDAVGEIIFLNLILFVYSGGENTSFNLFLRILWLHISPKSESALDGGWKQVKGRLVFG